MEHEHEHAHEHEAHHAKEPKFTESRDASAYILPGSVLISAILVAATVFYNTGLVVRTLENLQLSAPQAATPGGQGAAGGDTTPQIVEYKSRGDQPVMGNKSARVTVVEFADFQCPYCQRFFKDTLSEVKKQFVDTGKVKYAFRHFPLTQIHVNAQISSLGAECANQQGKFWEYHDALYTKGQADGTGLAADDLKKYADELGLNKGTLGFGKDKFNQCLNGKATESSVKTDLDQATQIGIQGTPSFLIMKGEEAKIDATVVRNAQDRRQTVINLSDGNILVVGAVPIATIQQAIDQVLKNN